MGFYSVCVCVHTSYAHIHSYFSMKGRTSDPWVCREINLLFSHLITKKVYVYQMSVTLSLWWITCITAPLTIWFVFLAALITKLHCWCIAFLQPKIDGTDEQKGTTEVAHEKKTKKRNERKCKKGNWLSRWWPAWHESDSREVDGRGGRWRGFLASTPAFL